LDLIASNGKLALAFEVKTFGGLKTGELLEDVERLARFRPQVGRPSGRANRSETARRDGREYDFWDRADRWGVVVVQSMMGPEFTKLWLSLLDRGELQRSLA